MSDVATDILGHHQFEETYNTPAVITQQFDVVYTGVGALTWLLDIAGWGRVVAAMLKLEAKRARRY